MSRATLRSQLHAGVSPTVAQVADSGFDHPAGQPCEAARDL